MKEVERFLVALIVHEVLRVDNAFDNFCCF